MIQVDDRILEHVGGEDWSSPSVMASSESFHVGVGMIEDRVAMLIQAGPLVPIASDMVEITTWGELCLEGDLDAEHQPSPDPQNLEASNGKKCGTTV